MTFIKNFIGGIFYFGGIILFFFGLYTFVSTLLGFNDEVAFSGAIAGIGFVAIIAGLIFYGIGKLILR